MNWIETIWSRLESHAQWGGMLDSLREGKHTVTLAGLTRTAKALAVAGLARQLPRPLIVVTDSNETADGMRDTIAGFLSASSGEVSGEDVVTLPALDCTPYQRRSPHPEVVETATYPGADRVGGVLGSDVWVGSTADLGRDEQRVRVGAEVAPQPADEPLAAPVPVDVGGAEQSDPRVHGRVEGGERVVLGDLAPVAAELPAA